MTTTITCCDCGELITTLGHSAHRCTSAPAADYPIAFHDYGILSGYAACYLGTEQTAEQLVQDETSCAWPDEYDPDYEDALRDAEEARRANEQREYDLAHAEPVTQPDVVPVSAIVAELSRTQRVYDESVRAGDCVQRQHGSDQVGVVVEAYRDSAIVRWPSDGERLVQRAALRKVA